MENKNTKTSLLEKQHLVFFKIRETKSCFLPSTNIQNGK